MKKITSYALFIAVFFSAPVSFAFTGMKTENTFLRHQVSSSNSLAFSYFLPSRLNINTFSLGNAHKDAADNAFAQGKIVVSAGYGFPNLGKAVITAIINASNATDIKATGLGPLHLRAEYGLSDKVGIAASVNYISYGASWTSKNDTTGFPYSNKLSKTSLSILARINFHFGITDKLDPYFGVGAGYKTGNWKLTSNDPTLQDDKLKTFSPFGFETTIGLRYYLMQGFGLYSEIGIAKSAIQFGVVASF